MTTALLPIDNEESIIGRLHRQCCYGENHYQSPAALYSYGTDDPLALDKFEVIGGTDPSYINWTDVDRLLHTITHIQAATNMKLPIAIGCKHGNLCGAGVGSVTDEDTGTITQRMILSDPRAISGGIVMINFPLTESVAKILVNTGGKQRILDGVVAPEFDEAGTKVLQRSNGRCRFYRNPALAHLTKHSLDRSPIRRQVRGGFLKQPNYTFVFDIEHPELEKNEGARLSGSQWIDMILAWAIGSTSNSNTITLVKNGGLIGNGVAQQDRVGACELAIKRARDAGHDPKGAVAYSDSFFPFIDGPEALLNAGVRTILTSSGSVKDNEVRAFCRKEGIGLYLIPDKIGRGFFGH